MILTDMKLAFAIPINRAQGQSLQVCELKERIHVFHMSDLNFFPKKLQITH